LKEPANASILGIINVSPPSCVSASRQRAYVRFRRGGPTNFESDHAERNGFVLEGDYWLEANRTLSLLNGLCGKEAGQILNGEPYVPPPLWGSLAPTGG